MMKLKSVFDAVLGISVEILYTLAIILSAFLICLAVS